MNMNPVSKALWYVENNFAGEITLDEIAGVAGVSRYHGRSAKRSAARSRFTCAAGA
jgi:AraC family transcriptional regulator